MELRKKKLEVDLQKNKLTKEVEKLKKENGTLKSKMEEVESVGDIFVLKSTLDELRLLSEVQRKEIGELKEQDQQVQMVSQMGESVKIIKQYEEMYEENKKTTEMLVVENQRLHAQNVDFKNSLDEGKKEFY